MVICVCCSRRCKSPEEIELPILPLSDYQIDDAWAELEQKTDKEAKARWGTEQALKGIRLPINIHQWAEHRAKFRIGNEAWSKVSWLKKGIITSEYPMPDFSDLLQKLNFGVVDLTRPGEIKPLTPRAYAGLQVEMEFFHPYQQGAAKGWHCCVWNDGVAMKPHFLDQMVQDIRKEVGVHKIDGLWVHCKAGIGRTGIFVSAILLKERIEKKQTTEKTLLDDVTDLVFKLRISQELKTMVYEPSLFCGIVRYGEYLLMKEEI